MKHVTLAIAQIAKAISAQGIAKTGQNAEDGYTYRTIDDILETLSPMLAENEIVILPTVIERECVERRTSTGMALFFATVRVRYDFTSTRDDSVVAVEVFGEAMDPADKATNKAMTAAYKVAVTQAFCIATKGNADADQETHKAAASMPAEERDRHEKTIKAAPDAKTIKSAYEAAIAAAKRIGDEEARKSFVAAKKARTEELAAVKAAAQSVEKAD
jgi:hypothetical protein